MRVKPYSLPKSINRVWINACIDRKTEIYELVTETEEPGVNRGLWHKEYPLGQGIADFLYANLDDIEQMIQQYRLAFEACASDGGEEDYERVFFVGRNCLEQSPLLLPLVQCMERLRMHQKTLEDVFAMLEEYKALQLKLNYIAHHFFETDKTDKMAERYWECLNDDPEHFIFLKYGTIRCGPIFRLYNNPDYAYPYNDPMPIISVDENFRFVSPKEKRMERVYCEVLETESPETLSAFLISQYIKESMRYKPCKFCHKLFGVTTEHGPSYCTRRLGSTSKTCKEAGSLRLYEQRLMEDTALREFKKSYKTHNARIRRGQMTREEFDAWAEEARTKRDQYLAQQLDRETFIEWLNQDIRN